MSVRRVGFGGKASLFTLEAHGLRAAISDFGAALVSLRHPDGTNLILGYDTVDGYLQDSQYMGVIVGRYANRLAHGRFPAMRVPIICMAGKTALAVSCGMLNPIMTTHRSG